jgi:hypothetical protein
MAWTIELTADYRGPRGRVVTSQHTSRVQATLPQCLALVEQHWQRVGRRRGTQLHATLTADTGEILRRCLRRD